MRDQLNTPNQDSLKPNAPNQELIKKVSMYLDNDLSLEAQINFLQELQQNPQHKQIFDKERSIRNLIRSNVPTRKASPTLIDSIKEKIKHRIPPV